MGHHCVKAMSNSRSLRAFGAIAAAYLTAGAAAALASIPTGLGRSPGAPASIQLARNWEFQLDPQKAGLAAGWQRGTGLGWQTVAVPHVFDPRPLPSNFKGTIGWYRLRFTTPATRPGFGWGLNFDQ